MIYVIYVQSGREHDVVATLRDKNINAYAPAHDLLERKGGVWRMVRRMIFPTYVFVNSEGITDELYYTVKNTVGVLRFLGRPPTPLPWGRCYPESLPAFPAGNSPTAPAARRAGVRRPAAALPVLPAAGCPAGSEACAAAALYTF